MQKWIHSFLFIRLGMGTNVREQETLVPNLSLVFSTSFGAPFDIISPLTNFILIQNIQLPPLHRALQNLRQARYVS